MATIASIASAAHFNKINPNVIKEINKHIHNSYTKQIVFNYNTTILIDADHIFANAFDKYQKEHGITNTKYYTKEDAKAMLALCNDYLRQILQGLSRYYKYIVLFSSISTHGPKTLPPELSDYNMFTHDDFYNLLRILKPNIGPVPEIIPETYNELYITNEYEGKSVDDIALTIVTKHKINSNSECYDMTKLVTLAEANLPEETKTQISNAGFKKLRTTVVPKKCERYKRREEKEENIVKLNRVHQVNNASYEMLSKAVSSLFEDAIKDIPAKCDVRKFSLEVDLTIEHYIHNVLPHDAPCIVISNDRDMLALCSDIKNCLWFDVAKVKMPYTKIISSKCVPVNLFWTYLFSNAMEYINDAHRIFLKPDDNRLRLLNLSHKAIKIIWSWLGNDYTGCLMNILNIPKLVLTTNAINDLKTYMHHTTNSPITNNVIYVYNTTFISDTFAALTGEDSDMETTTFAKTWRFNMIFSYMSLNLCEKSLNIAEAHKYYTLEYMWQYNAEHELWRYDKYQGENFYLEPDDEHECEKTTVNTSKGIIEVNPKNGHAGSDDTSSDNDSINIVMDIAENATENTAEHNSDSDSEDSDDVFINELVKEHIENVTKDFLLKRKK